MLHGLHQPFGVGSRDNSRVEHQPFPGHLRRSPGPDARRRQLAGTCIQVRGRTADRVRSGQGPLRLGRGWKQVHRLHRQLGTGDLRACPPRGDQCPAGSDREGNQLWCSLRPGKHSGRDGDRRRPQRGDGPLRQQRHRSLHGRAPTDAGLHRPGQGDQVRRLLSRPCGHVPGQGRVGCGDSWASRFPRGAAQHHGQHPHRPLQRSGGGQTVIRRKP